MWGLFHTYSNPHRCPHFCVPRLSICHTIRLHMDHMHLPPYRPINCIFP